MGTAHSFKKTNGLTFKKRGHKAVQLQKQLRLFIVLFLRDNLKMTFEQIGGEFGVIKQRAEQMYKEGREYFK